MSKDKYIITANDLQVRLYNASCCLATQADTLATQLKIGNYCKEDIQKLELNQAYIDILKCYNTDIFDSLSRILISAPSIVLDKLYAGKLLSLVISDGFTTWTLNLTGFTTLEELILEGQAIIDPKFDAVYDSFTDILTFIFPGSFSGKTGTFTVTFTPDTLIDPITFSKKFSSEYLKKIKNLDDINCLTTEQVNTIFEQLSTSCGQCFERYGYYDNIIN